MMKNCLLTCKIYISLVHGDINNHLLSRYTFDENFNFKPAVTLRASDPASLCAISGESKE